MIGHKGATIQSPGGGGWSKFLGLNFNEINYCLKDML